jgi:hypothetical protein
MADTGTNVYILARILKAKYGDKEFTKKQFIDELIEDFRFTDARSHEKYFNCALQWNQIKQTENGNFIATPKPFLSPTQKMELLENQSGIDHDVDRYENQVKGKAEKEQTDGKNG